jgi:hypothetical protein
MTKLAKFKHPSGGYAVMLAFALYFPAVPANAQFGAAAAQQQQGSQVNPLPLSGRTGASGGVRGLLGKRQQHVGKAFFWQAVSPGSGGAGYHV